MNIAYVSVFGENTTHYFVVYYVVPIFLIETSVICFIIYGYAAVYLPSWPGISFEKISSFRELVYFPIVLLESFNLLRDYYDT